MKLNKICILPSESEKLNASGFIKILILLRQELFFWCRLAFTQV